MADDAVRLGELGVGDRFVMPNSPEDNPTVFEVVSVCVGKKHAQIARVRDDLPRPGLYPANLMVRRWVP